MVQEQSLHSSKARRRDWRAFRERHFICLLLKPTVCHTIRICRITKAALNSQLHPIFEWEDMVEAGKITLSRQAMAMLFEMLLDSVVSGLRDNWGRPSSCCQVGSEWQSAAAVTELAKPCTGFRK